MSKIIIAIPRGRIIKELNYLADQNSEIHYYLGHYYNFGTNLYRFDKPDYNLRDQEKAIFHYEK